MRAFRTVLTAAGALTVLALSLSLLHASSQQLDVPPQSRHSTGSSAGGAQKPQPVPPRSTFLRDTTHVTYQGVDWRDQERAATAPTSTSDLESARRSPQDNQSLMEERFEGVFPSAGWTITGDPAWDDENCISSEGNWSAWCARGGSLGQWPCPGEVHYRNDMDTWMIYGPVDLSSALDAGVDFDYCTRIEAGYDQFYLAASTDNYQYYSVWESTAWTQGTWWWADCRLTDFVGATSVWIALIFQSDGTVTDSGVYVDWIHMWQYVQPDLQCYTPPGWPGPIVVSCAASQPPNQCSPRIIAGHQAYVWCAWQNAGGEGITQQIDSRLAVTSSPIGPYEIMIVSSPNGLGPAESADISFGWTFSTPGTYVLQLSVDHADQFAETDESNNTCSCAFVVSACGCDCHCDPACDAQTDILDVSQVINVAFRGQAPILDPNAGCPYQTTDVDCSNSTDIVDVSKMINVAFRGGNPATEFCVPCP